MSDDFARIERAFAEACARERILAQAVPEGGRIGFRFEGQENADPAAMLHHFELELRAAGVPTSAPLRGDEATLRGLAHAVARMRTLLIEHNSFLQDGVPYVFATRDETVRAAGLALYRYPRDAAVELTHRPGAFRIAFAPGPLGEVTSSGFYLLARFAGDFAVTVDYQLALWQPGPDSACLALFAQNLPSTIRYYSQITSLEAPPRTRAQSNLRGDLGPGFPASGQRGSFLLERQGQRLIAAHRDRDDPRWIQLGARDGDPGDELFFGCKIWSKRQCGGLVADLTELCISGAARDR